jgi:hypothetical protein
MMDGSRTRSGSVEKITDSDPGGQKHTDPTNPDPQHWKMKRWRIVKLFQNNAPYINKLAISNIAILRIYFTEPRFKERV